MLLRCTVYYKISLPVNLDCKRKLEYLEIAETRVGTARTYKFHTERLQSADGLQPYWCEATLLTLYKNYIGINVHYCMLPKPHRNVVTLTISLLLLLNSFSLWPPHNIICIILYTGSAFLAQGIMSLRKAPHEGPISHTAVELPYESHYSLPVWWEG